MIFRPSCSFTGRYKLSKLDSYYYLRLSSSRSASIPVPDTTDEPKTEHEKSRMNEDIDPGDETFVVFGSQLSEEGEYLQSQEKKANHENSSRHQSQLWDDFSEMWLIVRKSELNVLDVLFHTRY